MNSDFFKHVALFLGATPFAVAAEVSLHGNGRLTGDVTRIEADGTIEIVSPISEEPLRIRGDKAIRVDFGAADGEFRLSDQQVELSNGDMLPSKVISLADGFLNVESADLGQIRIPREMVSSIQLGIFPKRMIYSGTSDFGGWTRDKEGSRNWTVDGGEFITQGIGTISRDVGLTEKFIIRFSIAWDNYPNFQFRFAEPKGDPGESADRYIVQFVGSSFGILRESPGNRNNRPIVFLNRPSERLRDKRMDVEVRVDRSRGKLQLFIDGEKEGAYTDPLPNFPKGTGISLVGRAPQESSQRVSRIEVLEWDDRGDRHRAEDRGDGKSDSLIGRNGERHGGKLTGIRRDGDTSVYLFKSDFQKEVMEWPEVEVSTIFVGGQADSGSKDFSGGFILNLRGGGEMGVSSCTVASGKVSVQHPLLGTLEIAREGVTSLERRLAPKAKPTESR
jgi:hypothetical protein